MKNLKKKKLRENEITGENPKQKPIGDL